MKSTNPTTFAKHFGVAPAKLASLGVLNPTLALDTRLFVDPLLLATSGHLEVRQAAKTFRNHFELIIKLLSKSKRENDVAWRNSIRLFNFPEFPGTCLGYGAASVRGSAFGPALRRKLMLTAKEVLDLGITDTDLFLSLALFEENVGPDRISDLTCRVILKDLLAFNRRVLKLLKVPVESFTIGELTEDLPLNPFPSIRTPVILVPRDVLRRLPIVTSWGDVADAAAKNSSLRTRVNVYIGGIWERKSKQAKADLRKQALGSKAAFETLLETVKAVAKNPYDASSDPKGLLSWPNLAEAFTAKYPLPIAQPAPLSLDAVLGIVRSIVEQFRQLVEQNGLSKSFWYKGKALPERFSQNLFFAVAYAYCLSNNLDISPEVDSGNGQVDFKFAQGFDNRVLVEIKLSNHKKVIQGYTEQLEAYKNAEQTSRAIYLVAAVGDYAKKRTALLKLRSDAAKTGKPVSDITFIDARPKPSASKL